MYVGFRKFVLEMYIKIKCQPFALTGWSLSANRFLSESLIAFGIDGAIATVVLFLRTDSLLYIERNTMICGALLISINNDYTFQ